MEKSLNNEGIRTKYNANLFLLIMLQICLQKAIFFIRLIYLIYYFSFLKHVFQILYSKNLFHILFSKSFHYDCLFSFDVNKKSNRHTQIIKYSCCIIMIVYLVKKNKSKLTICEPLISFSCRYFQRLFLWKFYLLSEFLPDICSVEVAVEIFFHISFRPRSHV